MGQFLFYTLNSFLYQISDFFRRWYKNGFLTISHWAVSVLNFLDRYFAVKISLKSIFEPLFQDRTVVGYVLGFIFRLIRIFLGIAIYLAVVGFFVIFYIIWAVLPVYILFRAMGFELLTVFKA